MKFRHFIIGLVALLIGGLVYYLHGCHVYETSYMAQRMEYVDALPEAFRRAFEDVAMCDHVETEVKVSTKQWLATDYFNIEETVRVYTTDEFVKSAYLDKIAIIDDWYNKCSIAKRDLAKDYPVFQGIMIRNQTKRKIHGRTQEVYERIIFKVCSSEGEYGKHISGSGISYSKDGNTISTKLCSIAGCNEPTKYYDTRYCKKHTCRYCDNKKLGALEYCEKHKCQKCNEPVEKDWTLCRKHKAEAEARYKENMRQYHKKYSSGKSKPQYGDIDIGDYYEEHRGEFKSYDDAEDAFWDDYE